VTSTQALIAIAVVLGFWVVGAYNRLVGLRNVISNAWQPLDEQLRRRAELIESMLSLLRDRLQGEPHALEAAAAAQQQVAAAAETLRMRPLQAAGAASLVAAEGVLASATGRVRAWVDADAALRDDPAIATVLREQEAVELRLLVARQAFNDAVDAYNAAARQFPTTLVARLFGLRHAGRV
jgi:LemA protein